MIATLAAAVVVAGMVFGILGLVIQRLGEQVTIEREHRARLEQLWAAERDRLIQRIQSPAQAVIDAAIAPLGGQPQAQQVDLTEQDEIDGVTEEQLMQAAAIDAELAARGITPEGGHDGDGL